MLRFEFSYDDCYLELVGCVRNRKDRKELKAIYCWGCMKKFFRQKFPGCCYRDQYIKRVGKHTRQFGIKNYIRKEAIVL